MKKDSENTTGSPIKKEKKEILITFCKRFEAIFFSFVFLNVILFSENRKAKYMYISRGVRINKFHTNSINPGT